jgi:polyisoprenoid-binding protein YceI
MKSVLVAFVILLFSLNVLGAKTSCTYEFDTENSLVQGTGYKTTDKVGVTGQFPGIEINKQEKAKNPKDLLQGLVVTVNLVSLDSGNALRDKNMRETLFAGILGDSKATVTVKNVTDQVIATEVLLNEKTQKVDFTYSVKGDTIEAKGVFDALKYALGDQIAALKKRCGSLHTGADGKSVTWTDFDLSVIAKLKKTCQ